MIKKLIGTIALSVLLAVNANAATMTIIAPAQVTVGDSYSLQIFGDFSGEGFIFGAITMFWDAALIQLNGITLNLPVDDTFSCPGSVNCPPNGPDSAPIVWGESLNDLIEVNDPAPTLMATLNFTAFDSGLALFNMQDNPDLTGGWFGAAYTPIPTPNFGSASVVQAVPLPAAVWFMLSGLGALFGLRRSAA